MESKLHVSSFEEIKSGNFSLIGDNDPKSHHTAKHVRTHKHVHSHKHIHSSKSINFHLNTN